MMRNIGLAILVVLLLLAGWYFLAEEDLQTVEYVQPENGTTGQSQFIEEMLPQPPNYKTVVTDAALKQRLQDEAELFLGQLQGNQQEGASSGPMLLSGESSLRIAGRELPLSQALSEYGIPLQPSNLYYVHKVSSNDRQGVWGIVQKELIARFADGVALSRGENPEKYQLLIPANADERNPDGSSSFLGKVIWHKANQAVVVDTAKGLSRVGVDKIEPGQDVVFVNFERDQLVAIYQYFAVSTQKP